MSWVFLIGPAILVWAMEERFGQFLTARGLTRPNYAGRMIPTAYGLLLLLASLPFFILASTPPTGSVLGMTVAGTAVGFGLLGYADDRWGDRSVGGLKGHFRKLIEERELTTGALKALGGAWIALVLAIVMIPPNSFDLIVSAALIALTANSINLVDTRPTRAVALFLFGAALAMLSATLRRSVIPEAFWILPGACLPYLPVERARRGMLGDTGANLLGGVLGYMLALSLNLPLKVLAVLLLIGFHIFTERYSLNECIERNEKLRALDRLIQGPPPKAEP